MATLNRQNFAETGLNASYAAAAGGGDVVDNDGQTVLHVKNGGGAPINVTVAQQAGGTVNDPKLGLLTKGNVVVAVTNGQERFIGPFPTAAFNTAAGQLAITYSGVTSVTIAALKMPAQQ